jgi:putative transposase
MLTDDELRQLMNQRGLSAQARAAIDAARARPSHRVRSGSHNVSGVFPSTKMVLGIQFSSHKVELPAILELEYDPDVIAYWDKPEPLKLNYTLANGNRHSVLHTPSFLVIRRNGIAYEDWASEEDLRKGGERAPSRLVRSEAGRWRCPPAEAVAAAYGFGYVQRSSAEINWHLQANLNHLDDYVRARRPLKVELD